MSAAEFMEQRAVALATVLLTRHEDVVVAHTRFDLGHDLDVYIARNGVTSGRMFGVELKARLNLPRLGRLVDKTQLRLSTELRTGLTKAQKRAADLPYPLMYLAFAMDTDQGYYAWLKEPIVAPGARRLSTPEVQYASAWGNSTHVDVVKLVNQWYDATLTT